MKGKRSLTHKFIRYLILVILVSNCLMFLFQYVITRRNMKRQSMEMGLDLMKSNLTMIEQRFENIDNVAYSLIYNREIIRFLKNDTVKAADLNWLNGVESLYYNSHPDMQLSFYKAGKYGSVYSLMQAGDIEDYRYKKWYQELLWTGKEKILLSGGAQNEEFMVSVAYRINDVYSDDAVGYLKIDVDLEMLKKSFLHNYSQVAGTTILDEQGKVLFYDKLVIQPETEMMAKEERGVYETKEYIMSCGISQSTGWRLCMAMSKEELFRNQYMLIRTLLIVLASIVLITLLVSGKFFNIITVNYKRLVKGMEEVKEGNLLAVVEADTQDEISLLILEFNEMLLKLNELIRTVEAKQALLKEAEIKALQQQINPHFMHNIMETIMGLASEGMDREVIEVSECMSSMLRYNTRFENTTTLREEVEQIQNYVKVLKVRFEDRFEVFYDIDQECMDCVIVKFTLQPLVENAISHGLSGVWKDGMLRVRVKREEDTISILIYDNGTGIKPEHLEEMRVRLEETTERPLEYIDQYKSLGILNVHLRLRMYYGEKYSIEIFSKLGKGTCFSLKIPFLLAGTGQTDVPELSV
ncbi:sensor histidine kinase [Acetatifactor muris]|nr:sensor histidine kinase [Acetatifactor muris]MCI8800261.1 sensor histidine kinase [Lachnospiraceae bacterium]MCR2047444.1 sensor histidine kinase [Acetatifactor muris]